MQFHTIRCPGRDATAKEILVLCPDGEVQQQGSCDYRPIVGITHSHTVPGVSLELLIEAMSYGFYDWFDSVECRNAQVRINRALARYLRNVQARFVETGIRGAEKLRGIRIVARSVVPGGQRQLAIECWRPEPALCVRSLLPGGSPLPEISQNIVFRQPGRFEHFLEAGGSFSQRRPVSVSAFAPRRNVIANGVSVPGDGQRHIGLKQIVGKFFAKFANSDLHRTFCSMRTHVYAISHS